MNVHAIVSRYDADAFGLSSPQAPALFAGSDSEKSYRTEDIPRLLAEAGLSGDYTLQVHRQSYHQAEDREWFIRVKVERPDDKPAPSRLSTWQGLVALLEEIPTPIDAARKNSTGEVLFIVCELDDTIGWVSDQLVDGETAALVTPVGSDGLWVLDVHKGDQDGGRRVDDSTTLRELQEAYLPSTEHMRAQPSFVSHEPTRELSRTRELVGL